MPWLPVCFPPAPAVCAGKQFADDPVHCSCNMLSAAPSMILALYTLPPPHAKWYVCPVTCLPHVLHWKPHSDRHLAIFPVECHVFHQMHRCAIFKVLSSTSGGKLATLTRRIPSPTASIWSLDISPFSCRKFPCHLVAVNIACILCGSLNFM